MSEEYEGLCNSDYWIRNRFPDHWKGTLTRRSSKGPVEVAWNHVSASQIENFIKCKRLWFNKSILKISEGQKNFQSLGEAFHLIMEKVPKGLTYNHADVDASPEDWAKAEAMAKQALPLLPLETPTKVFRREQAIRLDTYDGGPVMVGYVDLGIPVGVGWPAFMIPANEAIVGDYKTLSDFRYMKTPQELADSVQMMTYAKWALTGLDSEPEHVRVLHMYARTKPPFIRTAIRHESAVVTPDEINLRWNKTLDIVRDMQHTSSCENSEDVEAGGALNGHCEAYGGCSFRDKCGIVKASSIKSLFQISKRPPALQANSTPTTESTPLMGSPILDKIKAARAAQAQASPGTVENSTQSNQPTGTVTPTTGVVPPDAPARAQAVITKPGDTVVDPIKVMEPETDEGAEDDTEAPVGVSTDSAVAADSNNSVGGSVGSLQASTEPKRRGRPSNAELEARKAEEQKAFEALVEAEVQKRLGQTGNVTTAEAALTEKDDALEKLEAEIEDLASQLEASQRTTTKLLEENQRLVKSGGSTPSEGFTLYVDCFPTKGEPPTDFFEWIGPICRVVAEQNSVGDWRQINYTAKGLLANALRETIKGEGLPKAMVVSSYAGGADIALEILTPLAKRVIKKL